MPFSKSKKKSWSSFPDPFMMIGVFNAEFLSRTSIPGFYFGEVVVVVSVVVFKAVVVVAGQVNFGHGHPFGQPDWHGHLYKFSF